MTSGMTPEERQRIAEEERIRLQTHVQEGTKFMKWFMKWYLIIIAVVIGLLACGCFAYLGFLGSLFQM